MWRRLLRISGALLALGLVVGAGLYLARWQIFRWREELPPFTHEAGLEQELRVAMRDGAELATSVLQPEGPGPWPTVLIRNPYEGFHRVVAGWCRTFNRYGYACVAQAVRGQLGSDGEWTPLVNEWRDGQDTLAWLVAQPWVDGNVALYGPSYLAAVQWVVAAAGLPPEVKTLVPTVSATDAYATAYRGGMFRQEMHTAWAALMASQGFRIDSGERYQQAIRHRPAIEADERYLGGKLPWFREVLRSPGLGGPAWQHEGYERLVSTPERLEIPLLMIGGWYDIFVGPQLEDYRRLASQARSKLVIGPWTHIGLQSGVIDAPGAGGGLAQWKLVLDWFGHHLRGEPLTEPPGASTYVMREGRWAVRESWPPPTVGRRLHLAGAAASPRCDGGALAEVPPASAESVSYTYDPDRPVPTLGGTGFAFMLPGFGGPPPATAWQEGLCEQANVLSFVSPPLALPLHLAGAIEVTLTVSSDAPDTAFTAKLVEVLPDGRAVNIRDGISSLAYRNGSSLPLETPPGKRVQLRIPLWPIEWQVPEGSRLRLDVSSSNFPAYAAHPNRAGLWSEVPDAVPARQTLWLGPGTEAYVDLPVLADEAVR